MSQNIGNFRSALPPEPRMFGGSNIIHTPFGNIVTNQPISSMPPPIPPSVGAPLPGQPSMYSTPSYINSGYNGYGNMGNFMGFGSGFSPYDGYGYHGNSYRNMQNNPESHFIRLAEESSRPAFQSIQSFVGTIANIANMLDSTFFALTSSFRALLGVAANFGQLRGMFGQFWTTFTIFRWINWLYRKLLYRLKMSNIDPSSVAFNEAFAAAQSSQIPQAPQKRGGKSPWPVLAFISFILTAPYLIMKLMRNVTNNTLEETRKPKTWVQPFPCRVIYDFRARSPEELSIRAGQLIWLAPKEIQNTHQLLQTGWALATVDSENSGLIPVSYLENPNQKKKLATQTPVPMPQQSTNLISETSSTTSSEKLPEKSIISETSSTTSSEKLPEKSIISETSSTTSSEKLPEKPSSTLLPTPSLPVILEDN